MVPAHSGWVFHKIRLQSFFFAKRQPFFKLSFVIIRGSIFFIESDFIPDSYDNEAEPVQIEPCRLE